MGLPWWVEKEMAAATRKARRSFHCVAFLPGAEPCLSMWERFGPDVCVFRVYEGYPPRLVRSWDVPTPLLRKVGHNEMAKQALSALAKIAAARAAAKAAGPPTSKADNEKYPSLVQLMTATVDESGKSRTPSKLTLTYDSADGGWRTMVVDERNEAIIFSHSDSLDGALAATEAHLSSDAPDWREDRFAAQRRAKKGK